MGYGWGTGGGYRWGYGWGTGGGTGGVRVGYGWGTGGVQVGVRVGYGWGTGGVQVGVQVGYRWGTGLPAMALMQAVQRLSCVSSLVTSPFSNKWFSRSALINFTVKCQGEDFETIVNYLKDCLNRQA